MTWLRLDDDFGQHPKVSGLSDRAFRVHILGLCYAAKYQTDGFIPASIRDQFGFYKLIATISELISAGLWTELDGGWMIHDFLEYNPPKAQLDRQKRLNRERQKRWRDEHELTRYGDALRDALVTAPRPDPYGLPSAVTSTTALDSPVENSDDRWPDDYDHGPKASAEKRRDAIAEARKALNAFEPNEDE